MMTNKSKLSTSLFTTKRTSFFRYGFACLLFGSLLVSTETCTAAEEVEAEQEESTEEVPQSVGFELGEFFIRDVRGSEGVKTRVSFTLYADVASENEATFQPLQKKHEQRIRDQIILAVRLCQTNHFQEPTLHSLKRLIWVRLHRMIPGFKINGLMFKDFAYFTD